MSSKVPQELMKTTTVVRAEAGAGVKVGDGLVVEMPVRCRRLEDESQVELPKLSSKELEREVCLSSGRRAVFTDRAKEEQLVVTSPNGRVELSVRFGESGPILSFGAAGIRLESSSEIAVRCSAFRVEAVDEIRFSTDGDIVQEIAGKASLEAHTVDVRSRRGNVNVKANDDVRLLGERVKLNC